MFMLKEFNSFEMIGEKLIITIEVYLSKEGKYFIDTRIYQNAYASIIFLEKIDIFGKKSNTKEELIRLLHNSTLSHYRVDGNGDLSVFYKALNDLGLKKANSKVHEMDWILMFCKEYEKKDNTIIIKRRTTLKETNELISILQTFSPL